MCLNSAAISVIKKKKKAYRSQRTQNIPAATQALVRRRPGLPQPLLHAQPELGPDGVGGSSWPFYNQIHTWVKKCKTKGRQAEHFLNQVRAHPARALLELQRTSSPPGL